MARYLALVIFLVGVPVVAAENNAAGFAPGSVWISKTSLMAGDTATLFTVLYNSSENVFSTDVTFTVDAVSVGTKKVSLDAGSSEIVSMLWTATTGSHQISARIENAGGVATSTAESVTVVVAPPPPPSAVEEASRAAAKALPVVQESVKGVFAEAERIRERAANALAEALQPATTTPRVKNGVVLGTTTAQTQNTVPMGGGVGSFFAKLWHGILSVLLYIFQTKILFYLVALFVIYMFYKLIRVILTDRRRR